MSCAGESGSQVAARQSVAAFARDGKGVAFSGSGWALLGGLARECHDGVCLLKRSGGCVWKQGPVGR